MDVRFEGQTRKAEEERLERQTKFGDGLVKKVPLGLRSRPTGRAGGAVPELSSEEDESLTATPGSKGENDDVEDENDDGNDGSDSAAITPSPKRKRRGSNGRRPRKHAKKDFEEELPTEETMNL